MKQENSTNEDLSKIELNTCLTSFKAFFENYYSFENILNICQKAELNSYNIRGTLWKVFLDIIPINRLEIKHIDFINSLREQYHINISLYKTKKRYTGNPLDNKNKEWEDFYTDTKLKKIINLDIDRTYQICSLFRSKSIKTIMHNILFLWSKLNYEYKQGMNEILGFLLYVMYPYYHTIDNLEIYKHEYEKFYLNMFDERELEADLYIMFSQLMDKGLKEIYYIPKNMTIKNNTPLFKKMELFNSKLERNSYDDIDSQKLHIQKKSEKIYNKLSIIDPEIYNYFQLLSFDHHIIFSRWLKCLFIREFDHSNSINLWDILLSSDKSFSKNANLNLLDYICITILFICRTQLLRMDLNSIYEYMFSHPLMNINIAEFIKSTIEIKKKFKKFKTPEKNKVNYYLMGLKLENIYLKYKKYFSLNDSKDLLVLLIKLKNK